MTRWWWAEAHPLNSILCIVTVLLYTLMGKKVHVYNATLSVEVARPGPYQVGVALTALHLDTGRWFRGPVGTLCTEVLFSGVFTFAVICMLLL